MATAEGVRQAFAKLHAAGYRMPKDAVPSALLGAWLEVMDGIRDDALIAAVVRHVNSDDRFWPVPGEIRTAIAGPYTDTLYWTDPDDPDREIAPPGALMDALRREGVDVEELKRRDAARRARNTEG